MFLSAAIDWANALKWPVTVILLTAMAFLIFRPAIDAWIMKVHHAKFPGGELYALHDRMDGLNHTLKHIDERTDELQGAIAHNRESPIYAAHLLPETAVKARDSLKGAADQEGFDRELLEQVSQRSLDLGWVLAKVGLNPSDVWWRWDGEEPDIVIPSPPEEA
ncbi:hypothetical protein [Streptomyces sp. WM6372]|uniref:hypothetical protein n=1 Tax=Streptomyces sp. WM6372 TaxID=1415555 RepID=UPI00131CC567|nr:hypothetical protein [Streptomyces sp. WM6372]